MAITLQQAATTRKKFPGPAGDPELPHEPGPLELTIARLVELVAQEAVVVDAADAETHQVRIRQLSANQLPEPASDLEQVLQLEMRAYREGAERKVEDLRRDLASTADAMQEYVTRFAGQDQNQEKLLTADLARLAVLRQVNEIAQIHAGIDMVRQSLATTVEQMKAQNQAIIAQLRDEIRTLHKRLDSPQRREAAEGTLASRAPFERRIRSKVESQEVFSLYLIRITNWKDIINLFEQDEAQTLVNTISERLSGILGPDTFTGRWYDGYFAAILSLDKRKAMEGASELAQRIAGLYTVNRIPCVLRARVAVIDHIQGQDATQMLRRVEQLIKAFES